MYPQGFVLPPPYTYPSIPNAPPETKKIGDWTRYTDPTGRYYYHNSETQKTVWDCPKEFKNEETESSNSSSSSKNKAIWTQHKNENGKTYYFNHQTQKSQWEKPDDFDESASQNAFSSMNLTSNLYPFMPTPIPAAASFPMMNPSAALYSSHAAAAAAYTNAATELYRQELYKQTMQKYSQNGHASHHGGTSGFKVIQPPSPTHEMKRKRNKEYDRISKEESKKKFFALLNDVGIKSDLKWIEILPAIVEDERYTCIKTLPERKSAYQEWKKMKKKEEDEEDEINEKAKNGFFEMLKENCDLDSKTRVNDIEKLFADDKRYKAIENKNVKKNLIHDYLRSLVKKERKERKEKRLKLMDEFDALIRNSSKITHKSNFRQIYDDFKDNECCQNLNREDIRVVVDEYLNDLKQEFKEEEHSKKFELKKKRKKDRENFRYLLKELLQKEKFHAKSTFEEVLTFLVDDSRYKAMLTQETTPEQLFDDFCEELDRVLLKDKEKIKKIVKKFDVLIEENDQIDLVFDRLKKLNLSEVETMKKSNLHAIIHEMIGKTQFKAQQKRLKMEEDYSKLKQLINHKKGQSFDNKTMLSFHEIKKMMLSTSGKHIFRRKMTENECLDVFNFYKRKNGDEEESVDVDGKLEEGKNKDKEESKIKINIKRNSKETKHDTDEEKKHSSKNAKMNHKESDSLNKNEESGNDENQSDSSNHQIHNKELKKRKLDQSNKRKRLTVSHSSSRIKSKHRASKSSERSAISSSRSSSSHRKRRRSSSRSYTQSSQSRSRSSSRSRSKQRRRSSSYSESYSSNDGKTKTYERYRPENRSENDEVDRSISLKRSLKSKEKSSRSVSRS